MPKYKVGDVAALFPKPKESTTEAGKKLQSLFSNFHKKRDKTITQSPKELSKPEMTGNVELKNQSKFKENKKRKLSSGSLKSDVNTIIKKFKKSNDFEETASPEIKEETMKNSSVAEVDFPRRKKKGNKFNFGNSKSFNSVESHVVENSPEKLSFMSNSSKSIGHQNNKQVSGFIKKSKHQNANKLYKSAGFDNSVKKPFYANHNSTSFKNENEKRKMKKQKSGSAPSLAQNANKLDDSAGTNNSVKQPLYKNDYSDTLSKNENEKRKIKKPKKKKGGSAASQVQNTDSLAFNQKKVSKPNEPDFIQLTNKKKKLGDDHDMEKSEPNEKVLQKRTNPHQKDLPEKNINDEEVLSRTLFVGNLPTNTTVKALKTFFSTFGPVESVRYHRIETDRKKMFKHGGPKERNLHYAAESVPAFIVFQDRESAVEALSLSGSLYEKRHITVDFAIPAGSQKHYDEKRSIFVGNLPFGVQDEAIWNIFTQCGKIEGVRIVRDKTTGIGKGFGYILFSSVQSKENALALEDLEVEGRILRIKAVDSNQKTQKKSVGKPSFHRDSFKSRAINYKKIHKDTSRKSVKKIMKKQKNLHKKKKIASFMQKAMK